MFNIPVWGGIFEPARNNENMIDGTRLVTLHNETLFIIVSYVTGHKLTTSSTGAPFSHRYKALHSSLSNSP